ncbi:hypothetical protein K2173_019831 [Erythroxylum novogranatense]|uniref:SAM-dependent MTase RsmB/NOP-type domain-containing protein n=1 Tax=Erythroxylum novogranatense TaxID=1862640 RepID=A0AAV8SMG7_9ROSI|nr:hypothetical protein K2173_019831 [Erythroxylum novogranatense]
MQRVRDLLLRTSTRRAFNRPATSTFKEEMDPKTEQRYSYTPILCWNPEVEDYFIKAYGPHHFSRISSALTHPSTYACIRVNMLKTTSDAVIQKLKTILEEVQYADSAKDILTSNDNACNPVMESLQSGSISKCQIPELDYVVFVKGSGPHVIDYSHKLGKPLKEVIVSRKCAEAVLRGAQAFVPGVMACSSHVEKGDVVAVSVAIEQRGADGAWSLGITRGTVLQGNQIDCDALLLFNADPYYCERSGLYIGQGVAMMSRAGIFRVSEGVAVDVKNRVFCLPSFHDVLEGEIFLQNLPSIVTAHAVDPKRGERILDMCAAPGGKTTALAILMKDEGEVVAMDRSHNKVLDIQKLATEMGLTCIRAYKLDALKAVCQRNESDEIMKMESSFPLMPNDEVTSACAAEGLKTVTNERENGRTYNSKAGVRKTMRRLRNGPGRNHCLGGRVEKCKGFSPDSFDRVLLDAPCSALGLRPRLFAGEETLESLRKHSKYQRRMFDQAVKLVRPGGVIVYSTVQELEDLA